jgi:CRP-like cAMP-binding protein
LDGLPKERVRALGMEFLPSQSSETADPMTILTERSTGVSRQSYRDGEIIFAQGEPAKGLFYIRQGKVRKLRISISGKARVIAVLGPQEFFGTKCIIDDSSERDCTVLAMTNCSVACID